MSDWIGNGTTIVPGVPPVPGTIPNPYVESLHSTLLPLDTYRKIMGMSPYHFWQMTNEAEPDCYENVYWHYGHQGSSALGRSDFIGAIVSAEQMLADGLGWWPATKYTYQEMIRLPRSGLRFPSVILGARPVRTKWMKVQNVGLLTWTAVDLAVDLVYGTGDDVAAAVDVGTVRDACSIVVCYSGTLIPIRPVYVFIDAAIGVATISIKKWLLGSPTTWDTYEPIDHTDSDFMLSTVDVYYVHMDVTSQISLLWEPESYACGCLQPACTVCSMASQSACATRGDYEHGIVNWQPASYSTGVWTSSILSGTRMPEMAMISYLHGLADGGCYMSDYWARIVAHLATALLPPVICGCDDVMVSFSHWQEDLAMSNKNRSYSMGQSALENPFGTARGAVEAWKAVLVNTYVG